MDDDFLAFKKKKAAEEREAARDFGAKRRRKRRLGAVAEVEAIRNEARKAGDEVGGKLLIEKGVEAIDPAFTHTNFACCFLPARNPGKVDFWEVADGNRTLFLQSGIALKAGGKGYAPGIPFGRYGRLAWAYVVDRAAKSDTAAIELPGVGAIMKELGLPTSGGRARKLFTEQLIRVVACHGTMAGVVEGVTWTANISFVEKASWRDEDGSPILVPRQLVLHADFHNAVRRSKEEQKHIMAINLKAWAALESPLAMDLYMWLAYQAPRGRGRPIPWTAVRTVLAPGATTEREAGFVARFEGGGFYAVMLKVQNLVVTDSARPQDRYAIAPAWEAVKVI